ncbi:hypothetical protein L596_028433 [Steinernema carpocapsae]|uniref:Uncharacterized protein n=1 Tax=Steinernema carpocapsae TaxID=34508 RepID=A0A4U5LYH7_STECR|nr:hypothetical protein L596_028433 [Steinernema carpocapsae]
MDTQNDPLWGLKMPEDELSVDVREQSEVEEPEVEVFEDQIEPEIDSEPKLEVQPKHKLPFAPLPSPTLKIRHDSELWSSTSAKSRNAPLPNSLPPRKNSWENFSSNPRTRPLSRRKNWPKNRASRLTR